MQILIGCAKTMRAYDATAIAGATTPHFQKNADMLAAQLAQYSPEELQDVLGVGRSIATENWTRYQCFSDSASRVPAIFGYSGMVFRTIAPETMDSADLIYANDHLFIGSFLYGLLRPLDLINAYRLEGNAELPCTGGNSLFAYWKPVLTDWFIGKVKADDGVLVNLASNEFRDILDWKRVQKELTVITPEFKVDKNGRLTTVVVYAKMCRGAMTGWILRNRISNPDELRNFEYEGYRYRSDWKFVLEQ